MDIPQSKDALSRPSREQFVVLNVYAIAEVEVLRISSKRGWCLRAIRRHPCRHVSSLVVQFDRVRGASVCPPYEETAGRLPTDMKGGEWRSWSRLLRIFSNCTSMQGHAAFLAVNLFR
jgi:hypothetical protein